TLLAALLDECAFFLPDETSSNPDSEIVTAVTPALLTTGGLLIGVSSPYARRGVLWEVFSRDYGPDGDPGILVAHGATRDLHPSLEQAKIDREYAKDPISASAEYGAQFRTDLEAFVSREVVDSRTDFGVFERPCDPAFSYCAFADPSGGSVDSFTLGIAHCEEGITILDVVREVPSPFLPSDAVEELCALIKEYKISRCFGDRYAVQWVVEQFALNGIQFVSEDVPVKSELYGSLLPMMNSRTVALVDHDRLRRQLLQLERRVG